MNKNIFGILAWPFRHLRILAALLLLALAAWGVMALLHKCNGVNPFGADGHEGAISKTPEEVLAIRHIGQWEFLSVTTEEMVERHERRVLGDRHLVRIYHGTIRIGLDTDEFGDDWFVPRGKTAVLTLPDVKVLDENFIDEARTTTFYAEGTFNAETKQQLYDEARRAMRARAFSGKNRKSARIAVEQHMKALFTAFGYDSVSVSFPKEQPSQPKKVQ